VTCDSKQKRKGKKFKCITPTTKYILPTTHQILRSMEHASSTTKGRRKKGKIIPWGKRGSCDIGLERAHKFLPFIHKTRITIY